MRISWIVGWVMTIAGVIGVFYFGYFLTLANASSGLNNIFIGPIVSMQMMIFVPLCFLSFMIAVAGILKLCSNKAENSKNLPL